MTADELAKALRGMQAQRAEDFARAFSDALRERTRDAKPGDRLPPRGAPAPAARAPIQRKPVPPSRTFVVDTDGAAWPLVERTDGTKRVERCG